MSNGERKRYNEYMEKSLSACEFINGMIDEFPYHCHRGENIGKLMKALFILEDVQKDVSKRYLERLGADEV